MLYLKAPTQAVRPTPVIGALPKASTQGVRPTPAIGALPKAPTQGVRPSPAIGALPQAPFQPRVEGRPGGPARGLPRAVPTGPTQLPNILSQPGATGAVPFKNIEGASANFSGILQALATVSSASDLSAIQDQIASVGGWDSPAVRQAFEAARARLADTTSGVASGGSNRARTGPAPAPVEVTDEDRALSAATTPIQETVARQEDAAIAAATDPTLKA